MGCTFDQFIQGCNQYLDGHIIELRQIASQIRFSDKIRNKDEALDKARPIWIKQRIREGMFDRKLATGIYAN